MSTDPQGSTPGPRHGETVDDATPDPGRRGLWRAGRPGSPAAARPVGLLVAVVAGLAVVSTGVAIGSTSLRPPTEGPGRASAAPQATSSGAAATSVPTEAPAGDEPVGDPDDAPTVDLPPSAEPPVVEWDDLPEPPQPSPTPEPVQPLPALPTLPPLAPVPDVVNPAPVPSDPSEPAGPQVPTLTGPTAGTVLITYPTVSGTAGAGVTVVVESASGDSLTTAVADDTGTWSAQVCGDLTTAPAACLTDADSLTVTAHARDDETGLESDASASLTWTFDRPVLTQPTDGAVIEVPPSGDVALRLDGTAGELVQLSVDGTPAGELHSVPSTEDVVWRSPAAGTHTLSARYVTVGGSGGTTVTGFGPSRTWTVTVAGPQGAPEGGPESAPDETPSDDLGSSGARPEDAAESVPGAGPGPDGETFGESR